ncbi:GNAT family N-acetyltransferase [Methylobacterium oxalidis]|uniref:Uncharacterized protein n=1 Tax=Methylobacterium oxalidis TaxID=944322 RepID=A0A512IX18_9HYPH|nr:GNAT family N-acetyltransferase [Methylobacterium oxalidis]GEP02245.1 hypothetical protein MOX02_02830 [Methylobacterium oxalidis]GJE32237.1 hypothetical protein LDDCCGHA_2421 [Methylobacterium oxalidis]GLS62190.1 hypothetical protein GCM10007888_05710 [Methylobacterium oxalidis]
MAQRFTVIAGGLLAAEPAAADSVERAPAERHWRIDLRAADSIDAAAVAAWRALLTRSGAAGAAFCDPDYLLPAAKHQSGGRALVFAWSRRGDGPESLRAVLPLAFGHPLWRGGRVTPWSPPGLSLKPAHLVEAGCAAEIGAALDARLRPDGRRLAFDLAESAGLPAPCLRFELLPGRAQRPARRAVPSGSLVGVRPADFRPEEVETISEPARIRDAVESFLALDARTAGRPIVADPSEAAMVRVVTRLFARRRAVRVELARRSGEIVAGSLRLGDGRRAALWRSAPAVTVREGGEGR